MMERKNLFPEHLSKRVGGGHVLQFVWTLLMFEAFLRNVVDAPSQAPASAMREDETVVA